jgi:hypothetical protein
MKLLDAAPRTHRVIIFGEYRKERPHASRYALSLPTRRGRRPGLRQWQRQRGRLHPAHRTDGAFGGDFLSSQGAAWDARASCASQ